MQSKFRSIQRLLLNAVDMSSFTGYPPFERMTLDELVRPQNVTFITYSNLT